MIVESIQIAGFRGFRDQAEVALAPGFNVIQGANGAGKSTLCDALEFCLTGEITKYAVEKAAKENVHDYIWWRGDVPARDHFVRVSFKRLDGQSVTVERTREGCNHSDEEIRDLFCIEGAPSDALGVLLDTTIIRDESIAALSLDLSDTERYQRVQRALGAVNTEHHLARAAAVARSVDDYARKSSSQVASLQRRMAELIVQRSEAQTQLSNAGAAPDAAQALSRLLAVSAEDHTALISAARAFYADRQAWLRAASMSAESARRIAAELTASMSAEFEDALRQAETKKALLEAEALEAAAAYLAAEGNVRAEKDADALAAAYAKLLEHGQHIGLQDGHCPLCEAAQSEQSFAAAIEAARARLEGRGERAAAAQASAEEARRVKDGVEQRLNVAASELSTLAARASSIESQRAELSRLANEVAIPVSVLLDEELLRSHTSAERDKMLIVEGHSRALISSSAYERLASIEANIVALQDELNRAEALSAQHQRASATAKAIESAIKRTAGSVVDERLAAINPLLSELYLRLKPHSDWRKIEYRIRGDVRKFLSLAVGDELNPQFVFSSGQRRITGLAFLLSVHLSRQWCSWNSLVLDDPVQHIDDFRALNLVEVLASIRMKGRQVICAVEDAALADLLCRRLRPASATDGKRIMVEQGPGGVSKIGQTAFVTLDARRVLDALPEQLSTG